MTDDQRDAARWRFIRQYLSTDGDMCDDNDPSSKHVQWLFVDDALSRATTHVGWTHSPESLVDESIRLGITPHHPDPQRGAHA